jgi:MFS family permease
MPASGSESSPPVPGRRALQALNFFMADMQAGIGPFLGVWLLAHGWQSGWIGSVMTLGGVAGVLMTTPAGAWVDASKHKRWLVVIPGICTVLASAIILISQSFWPIAVSQVATAIAGAAIGPAVAGITLGMFRQSGFGRQLGINQAYNHGGNAVGAALSGLLGWKFGLPAVFWLAVAFGVASIISVLSIPRSSIDDRAARGMREGPESGNGASGLSVLLSCKPLLVLAGALALFHLGNAAMLPLYGMAVVAARQGDPAALVAATIVVAQATMVVASPGGDADGGKGRLLVDPADFLRCSSRTGGGCRVPDQELGSLPGAGARWHRRRASECRSPRARRPDIERHRARQRRPGRRHDGLGHWCVAESGTWGLDCTDEWIPTRLPAAGRPGFWVRDPLAHLRCGHSPGLWLPTHERAPGVCGYLGSICELPSGVNQGHSPDFPDNSHLLNLLINKSIF